MKRILWLALFGAWLIGCPSVSTMGLARTLNRGSVQGYVAPGVVGLAAGPSGGVGASSVLLPQIEGGVRYVDFRDDSCCNNPSLQSQLNRGIFAGNVAQSKGFVFFFSNKT